MSEKKFPSSFSTIEIVQQCAYGFDLDFCKEFSEWKCIKDYAYILHDKDEREDGTIKEPHIHFMCRFNNPTQTAQILKKLEGVCQVQHLQKMKSWKSAIAYLTHSNVVGKHRYPDTDVVSNFDWGIDRDAALQSQVITFKHPRQAELADKIISGEIREYNLRSSVSAAEYTKWKRFLLDMLEIRRDNLLNKKTRCMDVLWMYGPSGLGKTWFGTDICAEHNLDYYMTACNKKDPLSDYRGQPAIILDDIRPDSFALVDLLALLNNDYNVAVQSRYYNKVLECDLLIVTCPFKPEDFWDAIPEANKGSSKQLYRRLSAVYCFDPPDRIIRLLYDSKLGVLYPDKMMKNECPFFNEEKNRAEVLKSFGTRLKGSFVR